MFIYCGPLPIHGVLLETCRSISNATDRMYNTFVLCGFRPLPIIRWMFKALPGYSGVVVERCVLLAPLELCIPAAQM